jgi:hypothetical protein
MSQSVSVLVDGIKTIGSHNGVSRVVFYTLNAEGEAEQTVQLLIPESSFAEISDVITRLGKREEPAAPIGFSPGG